MYEAYLWVSRQFMDSRQYNSDDYEFYNSRVMHQRLISEADRMRDEYEGRLFEDPLYLMQYTVTWEDANVIGMFQSPENDAFINAENEVYLRKVSIAISC